MGRSTSFSGCASTGPGCFTSHAFTHRYCPNRRTDGSARRFPFFRRRVECVGYDAMVLAGGQGVRMGHVDKAELDIAGTRMLDLVVSAVADAARIIVVGPRRETARPVIRIQEEPPGTG